jgi:hypothetical protein
MDQLEAATDMASGPILQQAKIKFLIAVLKISLHIQNKVLR